MEPRRRFIALLLLSCAPLAAAGAFLAFLLSATGTVGLLRWNSFYLVVVRGIIAAGVLPFAALSVFSLATRRGGGKKAKPVGVVLSCLSAFAALAMSAGLAFLAFMGSTPPKLTGNLNLLDKEKADSWMLQSRYLKFAFASDAHIGSEVADPPATRAIVDEIDSGAYDAFFVLGDSAEMGIDDSDLEAAYGVFSRARRVPLSFLMGNHDSLVAAAPRFKKAFGIPAPAARIDSGDLHIIALDLLWGTEDWSRGKSERLDAELAAIPSQDSVIVLSHCFFWSSGYTDPGTGKDWFDHAETTTEIAPILEKHKVDLIISGHNHYLEYLEKGDTGYLIVGALGGKLDPAPTHVSPYSKWFASGAFGFAEIVPAVDSFEIRFKDRDGGVLFEKSKPINR